MLLENVKLFCGKGISHHDRVWMSDGVESADDKVVDGITYEKDSFQPKLPWRIPTEEEYKIILGNDNEPSFSNSVGVVRMSDSLMSLADDLAISSLTSEEDLLQLRKTRMADYISFSNHLKQEVNQYLLSREKLHQIGWVFNNAPDRKTLTVNFKTGKLLGLHMDSWEAIFLSGLDKAPNRICINFGKEARYFLFINLTMKKVLELTEEQFPLNINSMGQDELTINFFKLYPEYPVLKIKIDPGEAYISPTENVIHDGNTEGIFSTDVHYTVRGFVGIKNVSYAT